MTLLVLAEASLHRSGFYSAHCPLREPPCARLLKFVLFPTVHFTACEYTVSHSRSLDPVNTYIPSLPFPFFRLTLDNYLGLLFRFCCVLF